MLRIAFRIVAALDRALASRELTQAASRRAQDAILRHGHRAVDVVLAELRAQRDGRSKRMLRMAVTQLIADRYIVVPLRPPETSPMVEAPC